MILGFFSNFEFLLTLLVFPSNECCGTTTVGASTSTSMESAVLGQSEDTLPMTTNNNLEKDLLTELELVDTGFEIYC